MQTIPMKVGIIAPDFPPTLGGIQTYACEVARELSARGHSVSVFTSPHPEGELTNQSYPIYPLLTLRRYEDRKILRSFTNDVWHVMTAAYAWWAVEVAPTVVSVHGNDILGGGAVTERLWLRSRFGIPFGDSLDYRLGRWLTRRVVSAGLDKASHIFANSEYTSRVLLSQYPKCTGKTTAAMVGVGDEFLSIKLPRKPPSARKEIITVCRLADRRKNVDVVLRALSKLSPQFDFRYTIVGRGPLQGELCRLSAELGMAAKVEFSGAVSDADLRALLARSDLFVLTPSSLPHSYEGFGIVYLEANACGTPTLAIRSAGAAEAVAEGLSGFFAADATTDAVSEALQSFFRGEQDFDPTCCREWASKFRWRNVVDHMLNHYPVQTQ